MQRRRAAPLPCAKAPLPHAPVPAKLADRQQAEAEAIWQMYLSQRDVEAGTNIGLVSDEPDPIVKDVLHTNPLVPAERRPNYV